MATCRPVPFALLGLGGVGAAFVESLLGARARHAEKFGLELACALVADSSGYLSIGDDAALKAAAAAKAGGTPVASMAGATKGDPAAALAALPKDAIIVDVSASSTTAALLVAAIERGQKVVAANKKPFSSEQATYDALVGTPRHGRAKHESTVGAGLPAVAALERLVAADDPVAKIAGTFSGTLGYVMTGLQEGRPFSEIVLEAKAKGYTEPDPRDDLGGVDVARKALILARGLGWKLELGDVNVTPLYPDALADLSVPDFLAALPSLDADFKTRAADAAAAGKTLRYAATVADGKLDVGLQAVALDSPLGSLSGTDNLVEYYTKWYPTSPLVVQGAGAGAGTTAAGVIADMVDLARGA